jgi:hypothetical protein
MVGGIMAIERATLTKVFERLGIVETKQDGTQRAVDDLVKVLRDHMRGHWRDFMWSVPTIILVIQFILSMIPRK